MAKRHGRIEAAPPWPQSFDTKMKAALGKNVRISLPKAYQINSSQNKCLAVKGVPTDISEADFLDFLNLNKISYAKAERLKSKKDGSLTNF